MNYYLLLVWRGVQPKLYGPFNNVEERDKKAKRLRNDFGVTASFFPIQATEGSEISIDCYSENFFE